MDLHYALLWKGVFFFLFSFFGIELYITLPRKLERYKEQTCPYWITM